MRRSLSLVGGLMLGVVLSQFPEYAQQYTQRLAGAVDELKIITGEFDSAAAAAGLSRDAALARYRQSPDSFLAGRGVGMAATFRRYAELSSALTEIRGANGFGRLQALPVYFDSDVGRRTLDDFKPAMPVTQEGLLYGGVGLGLGYLAVSVLYSLLVLPFRRRPRRRRLAVPDDNRGPRDRLR